MKNSSGHLRMGAGCQGTQPCVRGLELSVLSPNLWGREMDWRLNQSLMADDVINDACVINPHKTRQDKVWRASRLVSCWWCCEGSAHGAGVGALCPSP